MNAKVSLLVAILVLSSFGFASGQEVFVNVNDVEGLINGYIPSDDPVDLVIPVRFTNIDEARSCIANGYKFTGEGVTWTGIEGEWNPNYPFDWQMSLIIGAWPPFFDVGLFINNFDSDGDGNYDGVGFAGLSNSFTGLPADFDDIACYITLEGVQGDYGETLTMDSSFWSPANVWLWCGEPSIRPDWGGPYEFLFDIAHIPPSISSTPVTEVTLGSEYVYDVEAFSCHPITYFLISGPEGMVIDENTGEITWTPVEPGVFPVEIGAINDLGQDNQAFTITVYGHEPEPYTYCWPQPTNLGALDNDRILEIRVFEEYPHLVDPNSILIQDRLEPINDIRIEDGLVIAECRVLRFIGISGFRPIPPEGIQDTYTVEYLHSTKGHVTLTGDFVVEVTAGDVNLDGMADIADVQFMSDYFWGKGPKCEFEEFMDVDGNSQLDVRDALKLIDVAGI